MLDIDFNGNRGAPGSSFDQRQLTHHGAVTREFGVHAVLSSYDGDPVVDLSIHQGEHMPSYGVTCDSPKALRDAARALEQAADALLDELDDLPWR